MGAIHLVRGLLCTTAVGLLYMPLPGMAQVIPDSTLGTETSVVTPLDANMDRIDGGALRNSLLFHSFEAFSIPEGHGVYFANPEFVNTIFSRITGVDPSLLFGTLGVLGDADLMFINPNGILFGPNAQLDLRGAFTATTATEVVFPGGEVFSASAPEAAPLLTVNVEAPVGVVFEGTTPTAIVNQGDLVLEAGQVLTLSAGTIANFGNFGAPEGAIFLEVVEGIGTGEGWLAADDSTLESLGITEPFYGAELRQDEAGNLQLQGPGGYLLNEGDVAAGNIDVNARTLLNDGALDASGFAGGSVEANLQYLVNQGEILADGSGGNGGTIAVEATERILQTASAVTSATGVNGGEVTLDANEGGSLLSGTVTAAASTGVGGRVEILGDSPNLAGTTVDVSGDAGGGEILVGGDYQGQGDTPTAQDTVVNESAVLAADARINGDGGRVILWADGTTRFGGEISARGGRLGGDGGFVEVSGKEGGVFFGFVNASAIFGEPGKLLLDPRNITITNESSGVSQPQISQTYLNPSIPSPTFFPEGNFGYEVAIDGNNAVVSDINAGIVYLFDVGNGSLRRVFTTPTPLIDNSFGEALSVNDNQIVIGAPAKPRPQSIGGAYLFDAEDPDFQRVFLNPFPFFDPATPGSGDRDVFGTSVGIDGDNLAIAASFDNVEGFRAGAVYLYSIDSGSLKQIYTNPTPDTFDRFGEDISIDGNNLLVGVPGDDAIAPASGIVYLYSTENLNIQRIYTNPNISVGMTGGGFGAEVSISGENVLVGAFDDDTAAPDGGAAYLFKTNSSEVSQIYLSPNPSTNGAFGGSLALDGDFLVVGAPGDVIENSNFGAAYSFRVDSPEAQQVFLNPDRANSFGTFGQSLSLDRFNVLIGSPFDSTASPFAGAAYLFSTDILSQPNLYSEAPDESFSFDADFITSVTNTGTEVLLQANTDLIINEAITINNREGRGGSLTLQAGRSLLINSDIKTDDGNLTLIANDTLTNGVVDEFRDPGIAEIQMASGTTIDAGTGDVQITLDDGEGLTNNESGDITLQNITANNLTVTSNGRISGEGILEVGGDASFTTNLETAGTVTVTNSTATTIGNSLIGGNLVLNSANPVSQAPGTTLQVAGDISVNGEENDSLTNAVGISSSEEVIDGNVFITQVGTVILEEREFTGDLTVTSLSESLLGINTVLDAPAITLTNPDNAFDGTVELNTAIADDAITVEGVPGIVQSGPVNVSGTATLEATGGNINLSDSQNQFGNIAFSGNNVTITQKNDLNLLRSTAGGNLALTAATINQPSTSEQSGPLVAFGDITFTTTEPEAGNVNLLNTRNTRLGTHFVGGAYSLTSLGVVSQERGEILTFAGDPSIFAPAIDPNVNLLGSLPQGRVTIGDDVTISGAGPIVLEPEVFPGDLTVNSLDRALQPTRVFSNDAINLSQPNFLAGPVRVTTDIAAIEEIIGIPDITQSGTLEVAGVATFNTQNLAGNVTLEDAANQFGGVAFNASNVSIQEDIDTSLRTSNVLGNFSLITNGEISQIGGLRVEGNSSFTNLEPETAIQLNSANQLNGFITFISTGNADVSLSNTSPQTQLAGTTLEGDLTLRSGGDIVQSGPLAVAGTTSLSSGSNRIDFLDQNNNFNRLNILGAGAATINESNDIALEDSFLFGDLVLTAQGSITSEDISTSSGNIQLVSVASSIDTTAGRLRARFPSGQGGSVSLQSLGNLNVGDITVDGVPSGDISLSTQALLSINDRDIESINFGPELGGNIILNADIIEIINGGRVVASTADSGDGGVVTVTGRQLRIQGSPGQITGIGTDTLPNSSGDGGDQVLMLTDSIEIVGTEPGSFIPDLTDEGSVLRAASLQTGITSATLGSGEAGDITITTNRFNLREGAGVTTSSLASVSTGVGGTLRLNANDVEFRGLAGLASATLGPAAAGNVIVNADQLALLDGAAIVADAIPEATTGMEGSLVFGSAGDIEIEANSVLLDNLARISTSSTTGNGGNITLNDIGVLLMRRGASPDDPSESIGGIFTDGGANDAIGDGGRIFITADTIFAVDSENTDISARAFLGIGGGIRVEVGFKRGIEFRDPPTSFSDITIASEFGEAGTADVEITALDPTQGLAALPDEPQGPEVIEGCAVRGNTEAVGFFDVGRGGRLLGPDDLITTDAIVVEWTSLELADEAEAEVSASASLPPYLVSSCGIAVH